MYYYHYRLNDGSEYGTVYYSTAGLATVGACLKSAEDSLFKYQREAEYIHVSDKQYEPSK